MVLDTNSKAPRKAVDQKTVVTLDAAAKRQLALDLVAKFERQWAIEHMEIGMLEEFLDSRGLKIADLVAAGVIEKANTYAYKLTPAMIAASSAHSQIDQTLEN